MSALPSLYFLFMASEAGLSGAKQRATPANFKRDPRTTLTNPPVEVSVSRQALQPSDVSLAT
jgi:hypothetical protein